MEETSRSEIKLKDRRNEAKKQKKLRMRKQK
jgi:hypothetical protein